MKSLLLSLFLLLIGLPGWCQISGDTASCKGKQSVFSSSHNSSANLLWSVTGSNNSITLTPSGNFLVTWSAPGTYIVSVIRDSSGHVDTSVLSVVVHDLPYPYIQPLQTNTCLSASGLPFPKTSDVFSALAGHNPVSSGCYGVCDSGWYQYSVYGQAGSTFQWYSIPHDSIRANIHGDTISVHWAGPGDRILYCTETNIYGCQNTTSICVSVIGRPKACMVSYPADSNGVLYLCRGASVTFNDNCSSVAYGSDITSRVWQMGDGAVFNNQTVINYSYNTPGTYQLLYYVQTNCSCADTFRRIVIVDSSRGPDIFCISTTCSDSISIYRTSDTCSLGYRWSVTYGDTLWTHGDSVAIRWGSADLGYGIISLRTNCPGGCPYNSKAYVPIVPHSAAITGPQIVCSGESDLYSVPFVPSTVYTWYKPSAPSIVLSGQTSNELDFRWSGSPGTVDSIKVKYSNPFLHCGGISSMPVYIADTFRISGPAQGCMGLPDTFVAHSFGIPIQCDWSLYSYSGSTLIDTGVGLFSYTPVFPHAGTYRVRAYPSAGGYCGTPQVFVITIYDLPPSPTAPIVGSDTVCAGEIYTYTSSSGSLDYYLEWKTYNATPVSASGNQIQLTWAPPFNDTLYVRNVMIENPGCPSPWRKEIIYPLTNLHPTISGDTSSCTDQHKSYSTTFVADDYQWSVSPTGAGSVSAGQNSSNATIQWNHTTYLVHAYVILQIRKCSQTVSDTIPVSIYPIPDLVLTIDSPICAGVAINLSVSPGGTTIDWNYGDGSTHGTTASVTHTYTVDRSYSILVTVTDPSGCTVTLQAAKTIHVNPTPSAYLSTPDNVEHCTHSGWSDTLYTTLQNMGTAGITYQLYNGGSPVGGAGSSGTYILMTAGTFSVHVTTAAGCSAITNNVIITDTCTGGGDTTTCMSTDTMGLTDSYDCGVLTLHSIHSGAGQFRYWTISDAPGQVFFSDPLTYTCTKAGYYDATVYGIGASGGDTCRISYRRKVAVPLVAGFDIFYECDGNVMKTRLVDISTYIIDSISHWQWSVDDTVRSTDKNPLLTVSAGVHTFRLKVWNGLDTCEVTHTDTVPARPHASFTPTDSTCSGNAIHFVSTSTPSADIISYMWHYGDNTSSTLNPSDRTYTCTASVPCGIEPHLIITDKYGCVDSTADTIHIMKDGVSGNHFCVNPEGVLTGCLGQSDTINIGSTSIAFSCDNLLHQIVYYKYSWSNGAVLYNDNLFPISQTGAYSVTITDEYNCRKTMGPITAIFGNINAQITGDTVYCIGDKTYLNIFTGRDYTYSWLRKTSTGSLQAYNPATDKPYLMKDEVNSTSDGTLYWGIVADPVSGCADTVGPLRIHTYPAVTSPYIVTTSSTPPCVSHGSVTLTVSNSSASYFLWNNGVVGNSIVVVVPGSYVIDMIDTNGCDAGDTVVPILPGPDFTQLLSGCFPLCIGDTLKYQGPTISNATYHWLEDGIPLSSIYTPFAGRDLYVYGRVGQHVYRLDMERNNCRDTSEAIYIDWVSCPDRNTCIDIDSTNITCQNCIEDSSNGSGDRHYSIVLHVHHTGGATISPIQILATDTGYTISNFYPNYMNASSVNGGWNTFSISLTDTLPYRSSYCIVIRVSDACQYTYCFTPAVTCRKL